MGQFVPENNAQPLMQTGTDRRTDELPAGDAIDVLVPVEFSRSDRYACHVLVNAPGKSELKADEDDILQIHHHIQDRRYAEMFLGLTHGSAFCVERRGQRVHHDIEAKDGDPRPDPTSALENSKDAQNDANLGVQVNEMS